MPWSQNLWRKIMNWNFYFSSNNLWNGASSVLDQYRTLIENCIQQIRVLSAGAHSYRKCLKSCLEPVKFGSLQIEWPRWRALSASCLSNKFLSPGYCTKHLVRFLFLYDDTIILMTYPYNHQLVKTNRYSHHMPTWFVVCSTNSHPTKFVRLKQHTVTAQQFQAITVQM